MDASDHTQVLERLRDLEGWADYIVGALHRDPKSAPVKKGVLEGGVQQNDLRQLRELSWSLRDKLHVVTTQLELTCPLGPPVLGGLR